MNLRTYQMKSHHQKYMATENGLYAQVVMISRREFYDKKEIIRLKNIISKDNQQEQTLVQS